jgi:hypothetical protein
VTRADTLLAFLEEWQDKPIVWGESDCSAWPALWFRIATGDSVLLPAYSARGEAVRHIVRAGSLVALWRASLADTRAYEIEPEEARLGDVGVIEMSDGPKGFIFANAEFGYVKAEIGILPLPARHIVAAWRV